MQIMQHWMNYIPSLKKKQGVDIICLIKRKFYIIEKGKIESEEPLYYEDDDGVHELKPVIPVPAGVDEIYSEVWKETPIASDGVVSVHIRHLREKHEEDPNNPVYIKTVRGMGIMFKE